MLLESLLEFLLDFFDLSSEASLSSSDSSFLPLKPHEKVALLISIAFSKDGSCWIT
jgi:hypothetical protein